MMRTSPDKTEAKMMIVFLETLSRPLGVWMRMVEEDLGATTYPNRVYTGWLIIFSYITRVAHSAGDLLQSLVIMSRSYVRK